MSKKDFEKMSDIVKRINEAPVTTDRPMKINLDGCVTYSDVASNKVDLDTIETLGILKTDLSPPKEISAADWANSVDTIKLAASAWHQTSLKLDWNKVKTIEDVVLVLKEIYPNPLIHTWGSSFEHLKHLAVDEQSDK